MLCITRYSGESFVLILPGGEEVYIQAGDENEHRRFKVRISAPPSVKVLRTELLDHEPTVFIQGKLQKDKK